MGEIAFFQYKKRVLLKLQQSKPGRSYNEDAPSYDFLSVDEELEELSQVIENSRNKAGHSNEYFPMCDDQRGKSGFRGRRKKTKSIGDSFGKGKHMEMLSAMKRKRVDTMTKISKSYRQKRNKKKNFLIRRTVEEETTPQSQHETCDIVSKGEERDVDASSLHATPRHDGHDKNDENVSLVIIEIGEQHFVEKEGILEEYDQMEPSTAEKFIITTDENGTGGTNKMFERCGKRIENHAKRLARIRSDYELVTKKVQTMRRILAFD